MKAIVLVLQEEYTYPKRMENFVRCKPVVATNIPHSGVSWVNAHGFSGLNVTPCSAKELAGAIMTITRNDDLYQKLAKGARERYQETFTKEKMIDNILEIYRSLWKK